MKLWDALVVKWGSCGSLEESKYMVFVASPFLKSYTHLCPASLDSTSHLVGHDIHVLFIYTFPSQLIHNMSDPRAVSLPLFYN